MVKRNSSDGMNIFDDGKLSDFEALQGQLDDFMKDEQGIQREANEEHAAELQGRLDHFMDDLQQQLDATLLPHEASTGNNDLNDSQLERDEMFESFEQASHQLQLNKPARAATQGSFNAVAAPSGGLSSYAKLITRTLMGAACLAIGVLWFFWPTVPVSPPQGLTHVERFDASSVGLASIETESYSLNEISAGRPEAQRIGVEGIGSERIISERVEVKKDEVEHAEEVTTIASTEQKVGSVKTQSVGSKASIAPATAGIAEQVQSVVSEKLIIAVNIGNIRNAPDSTGKVLFRLKQGAVVSKLSQQGDWYQVRLRNGVMAWAHQSIF